MKRVKLILVFLVVWCLGSSSLVAQAGMPGGDRENAGQTCDDSGSLVFDTSGDFIPGPEGDPGDSGDGLGADDNLQDAQESEGGGPGWMEDLLALMLRLRLLP